MPSKAVHRGPVGIADALVAAHHLRISDAAQLADIVALLGLDLGAPADVDVIRPRPLDVRPSVPHVERPEVEPRRTAPEAHSDGEALPTHVETLDPRVGFSGFVEEAQPLAGYRLGAGGPPYEPPVPAAQVRAALSAIAHTRRDSDRLDVEEVVEQLGAQEPLHALPMETEFTVGEGMVIVADIGAASLPYHGDLAFLVGEATAVVGEHATEVSWVDDDTAVELDPDDGRPLLVLSTLEAARPPSRSASQVLRWRAMADVLQASEQRATALVPHRRRRWPAHLTAMFRIVSWDDLAEVGRGRG